MCIFNPDQHLTPCGNDTAWPCLQILKIIQSTHLSEGDTLRTDLVVVKKKVVPKRSQKAFQNWVSQGPHSDRILMGKQCNQTTGWRKTSAVSWAEWSFGRRINWTIDQQLWEWLFTSDSGSRVPTCPTRTRNQKKVPPGVAVALEEAEATQWEDSGSSYSNQTPEGQKHIH